MGILAVIVAALAGFAFGAVWYMALQKPWVEASGIEVDDRGIPVDASVTPFGIGLFFISPWIMINNSYGRRPFKLTVIDGGYATFGCAIMGAVLALMS